MNSQYEADLRQIVEALEPVLPSRSGPYALHEPTFSVRDHELITTCLDQGWVSSAGAFVGQFEQALVDYTGATHAVAVVNGTAAMHLALHLVGVKPGDEVLMPALTFVATANAVSYCGATPHFLDSEPNSFGVDAHRAADYLKTALKRTALGVENRHTGRPVTALVAVHIFGHPGELDELSALCLDYGITFVEDAAESLGSFYKGRHTGRIGRMAALSFNGNKIITTGGGGAIMTDDEAIAQRARHLSTTAKLPHQWAYVHDEIGFNYRMPNLNAALGCSQMERLAEFVADKRALAQDYASALRNLRGARHVSEPQHTQSNYWLNALLLERDDPACRDRLLELLHERGIKARPLWTLMHHLPMYSACPRMDLSCAENLERRIINLPSSPGLARHGSAARR